MHQSDGRAMAREVARLVAEKGGRTFYVGGFVRDALLHQENKDVDIEVHGITPGCLAQILDSLGQRMTVGESFGIFGLKGHELDIAMPRKEEARGQGHRDFDIFLKVSQKYFPLHEVLQILSLNQAPDCQFLIPGCLRKVLLYGSSAFLILLHCRGEVALYWK